MAENVVSPHLRKLKVPFERLRTVLRQIITLRLKGLMSAQSDIKPSSLTEEPVALVGAGLSLAGPRDFFQLMKPRVMSLVIFTAIIGLLVAPGSLPLYNSVMAILCIAVGAGASGALNMWYDADIDAQMTRTKKRPLPRGIISPGTALTFGFLLSVVSVWMLGLATNYVAAGLLALRRISL